MSRLCVGCRITHRFRSQGSKNGLMPSLYFPNSPLELALSRSKLMTTRGCGYVIFGECSEIVSASTRFEPTQFTESVLDIIELEPLVVHSKYRHFVFDHEKRILKSVPFTWKHGGTFSRNVGPKATTEWKFQYDPRNNVIQFLSISF